MNWRRGLFRIWIVIAVVWACVVAFESIQTLHHVSDPIVLKDGEQSLEFPGDIPRARMKTALIRYFAEKDKEWELVDSLTKADAAGDLASARKSAETIRAKRDKNAERVMGSYEPRSRLAVLIWAVCIALSLPALLLAGGYVGFWIVRGFQTKP